MQITTNKVVSIDYTLKDKSGEVIDSSEGSEPLSFIFGIGALIPGLEEAMDGKTSGDKLSVEVPPEKGYGERADDLIQSIPREFFDTSDELKVGMQFQEQGEHGVRIVTIVEISGEEVKVDGNHPLAGETLYFDVTVNDVRDATQEELSHGHVHGAGHHH